MTSTGHVATCCRDTKGSGVFSRRQIRHYKSRKPAKETARGYSAFIARVVERGCSKNEPTKNDLITANGYLKPSSRLPMAIPSSRNGQNVTVTRGEGTMSATMTITATMHDGSKVQIATGRRRYVTGLLLQRVRPEDDQVFRRVGLCQMYHFIWEGELASPQKRQQKVIVI